MDEVSALHVRATVLPDGVPRDLWVDGGVLTTTPVHGAVTLADGGYAIPGLVDVHAHLALASPAPDGADEDARVRASALAHLEAGVLALREPGGPGYGSVGLGPQDGLPRVITAGRFLSPPGRYFPGLAREVTEGELPLAAVAECQRSGGRWAKVIGDSPVPGPYLSRTFSDDALRAAADRVHRNGGRIAIHCSLPDVIAAAVESGFDSLEHGTFLESGMLADLARHRTAWVPTLSIDGAVRDLLAQNGTPRDQLARAIGVLDRQAEVLRAAADAGVLLLAGTDAGLVPHGGIRREIALLHAAGLPAETALAAGSWTARSWLGLPLLEEGAPADLVLLRDDPRDDLATLDDPIAVVLDGVRVR